MKIFITTLSLISLVLFSGCSQSDGSSESSSVHNTIPDADAGADQNVSTTDIVTLDGSASSDADGDTLTYSWSILSKPLDSNATLSDSTLATPRFTTDSDGNYVLQLIVNDGTDNSVPDTMTVVSNTAVPPNTIIRVSSDWYVIDANVTVNGLQAFRYLSDGEYEFNATVSGVRFVTLGINDMNSNSVSDLGEAYAPSLSAPDGYTNINPFTTMLVNGVTQAVLSTKYPIAYNLQNDFDFDVVAAGESDLGLQKEVAHASLELSAG